MKHKLQYAQEATKNIRVDRLLADTFPEYSRSAITKLFDLKLIKIKGESIQPGFKVRPGETVEYDLTPLQQKPDVIDLPVSYEDNDVIVINKPAGIISHARGRFWQEASVASFIRDKISKNLDGERGGIVHRLDRVTSGVMICAKNEDVLIGLQRAFSERKVSKKYLAFVAKKPKLNEFIIDAPILRDPKSPKKFIVDHLGKHAQTKVTVLTTNEERTLLLLEPITGRTHQLRVHLNYLSNPIIGDPLYGKSASNYNEHSNSLRLHAYSLSIPIDGQLKTFIADVPDYWKLTDKEIACIKEVAI